VAVRLWLSVPEGRKAVAGKPAPTGSLNLCRGRPPLAFSPGGAKGGRGQARSYRFAEPLPWPSASGVQLRRGERRSRASPLLPRLSIADAMPFGCPEFVLSGCDRDWRGNCRCSLQPQAGWFGRRTVRAVRFPARLWSVHKGPGDRVQAQVGWAGVAAPVGP